MSEHSQADLAIAAKGLVKRYEGDVLAVDGVDLAIPANTIYALLGPNGAGKTTTVSLLSTLLEPNAGSAAVAGFDVLRQAGEVRRRIGVTFQEMVLDEALTGHQALEYHGRLYGMDRGLRQTRIGEMLALVELQEAADRRIGTYSGGMKRRLELARGLMTRPQVLFLDEPTTGLDPQNRTSIWEHILHLKREDALTLILTTHYMEEAERLADRVGIMDHGTIVAEGRPQELIAQMGADTIHLRGAGDRHRFAAKLERLPFVQALSMGDELIQLGVDQANRRLVELVSLAAQDGFTLEDISVAKPSLGDVFLKYTGRRLRDR
jgi:ABC-2 type transport system ATP-binding protein